MYKRFFESIRTPPIMMQFWGTGKMGFQEFVSLPGVDPKSREVADGYNVASTDGKTSVIQPQEDFDNILTYVNTCPAKFERIIDGGNRKFAAELHTVLALIDNAYADWVSGEGHSTSDYADAIKKDILLMREMCRRLDGDYRDGFKFYSIFKRRVISVPGIDVSIPIGEPYDGGDIVIPFMPDNTDNLLVEPSAKRTGYVVCNLFQYCFATIDYIVAKGLRLKRCKRCGRYFVAPQGLRNISYCTVAGYAPKDCRAMESNESAKEDLTKKLHKQIYDMLSSRNSDDVLRYLNEAKQHRTEVKCGRETLDDYCAWLQAQATKYRKYKKNS